MSSSWSTEETLSTSKIFTYVSLTVFTALTYSIFRQLFFRPRTEPPAVFHWIPYIGSAVAYGTDPVSFFEKYRAKVIIILPDILSTSVSVLRRTS